MMKKTVLLTLASCSLMLAACGNANQASTSPDSGKSDTSSARSSDRPGKSTESNSSKEASSEEVIVPEALYTGIMYCEGIMQGGEADSIANPGKLVYWSGDGGSIYSFEKSRNKSGNDELVLQYMNTYMPDYETGWGWYGCQIFYTAPYALGGDSYTITFIINSDVAGDITVNGQVVSLKRGDNKIVLTHVRGVEGQSAPATFSIQLGTGDAANKAWSTLQGSALTFKSIGLEEKSTYFQTKFVSGEQTLKDIQVRSGKTVTAPKIEVPEGKILKGWFDGEKAFNSAEPVTEAHTYLAEFVDASEVTTHKVTIKKGQDTVDEIEVVDGNKADLGGVKNPFAYRADRYYTDVALTTPFDLNSLVTEDITIYGKYLLNPTFYIDSADAGYTFHDEIGYAEDGGLVLTFDGWGAEANWAVQVNFRLPIGEVGTQLAVTFKYRINRAGGAYRVYDGEWYSGPNSEITALEVSEAFVDASASWEGGSLSAGNKLTFELGQIPEGDTPVVFELTDFALTAVA